MKQFRKVLLCRKYSEIRLHPTITSPTQPVCPRALVSLTNTFPEILSAAWLVLWINDISRKTDGKKSCLVSSCLALRVNSEHLWIFIKFSQMCYELAHFNIKNYIIKKAIIMMISTKLLLPQWLAKSVKMLVPFTYNIRMQVTYIAFKACPSIATLICYI